MKPYEIYAGLCEHVQNHGLIKARSEEIALVYARDVAFQAYYHSGYPRRSDCATALKSVKPNATEEEIDDYYCEVVEEHVKYYVKEVSEEEWTLISELDLCQ